MTPTPNPTAEQIIREVLRHAVVASGETLGQWTGAVVSELRAHNLLSDGTPSEAQVEAAAKALRADEGFMAEVHSALEVSWSEYIAKLVLVAAQGAAPQAESVPKSSYINPHLPAQIRGLYRADLREKSIQTMLDLAGDLIQELIDLRAAPVLPSSGVDEDKLTEVIARVTDMWDDPLDEVHDIPQIARAVAAWLRVQGGESRATRE